MPIDVILKANGMSPIKPVVSSSKVILSVLSISRLLVSLRSFPSICCGTKPQVCISEVKSTEVVNPSLSFGDSPTLEMTKSLVPRNAHFYQDIEHQIDSSPKMSLDCSERNLQRLPLLKFMYWYQIITLFLFYFYNFLCLYVWTSNEFHNKLNHRSNIPSSYISQNFSYFLIVFH